MEDKYLIRFTVSQTGYRYLEKTLVKNYVQEAIRKANEHFPGLDIAITVTLKTLPDDLFYRCRHALKEIELNGPLFEERPNVFRYGFFEGLSNIIARRITESQQEEDRIYGNVLHAFLGDS